MNVFRMMGKMEGEKVAVTSSGSIPLEQIVREGVRGSPDVSALTSRNGRQVAVLVWHYHDDDVSGPSAQVELILKGLFGSDGAARLAHYRIDEHHSNAYAVWKRMGSPPVPDEHQYEEFVAAGSLAQLEGAPQTMEIRKGTASMVFELPRQAVSLLVLTWE
jgi:xylan 1,4-beta-xylosidase